MRLRFTVKDTGIGMTPEFMEQLSSLLSRKTDVTIRKVKVPDWGNVYYRNLITLMGGTIAVERAKSRKYLYR